MPSIAQKKRAERLFQWKQDGVQALSEYEDKERATRLLTAKLRTERLVREAMSGKRVQKKSAKAQANNHRLPLSRRAGGAMLSRESGNQGLLEFGKTKSR
ncbi:MAG: hypothetical protein WBC87_25825 [Pseudolabrys sp.]|jgi:hypothetical protein